MRIEIKARDFKDLYTENIEINSKKNNIFKHIRIFNNFLLYMVRFKTFP